MILFKNLVTRAPLNTSPLIKMAKEWGWKSRKLDSPLRQREVNLLNSFTAENSFCLTNKIEFESSCGHRPATQRLCLMNYGGHLFFRSRFFREFWVITERSHCVQGIGRVRLSLSVCMRCFLHLLSCSASHFLSPSLYHNSLFIQSCSLNCLLILLIWQTLNFFFTKY